MLVLIQGLSSFYCLIFFSFKISYYSLSSLSSNHSTPLHVACSSATSSLECINSLLEKKVPVNIPNQEGSTPLVLACKANNFEIVKLLLKYNATVREPSQENSLYDFSYFSLEYLLFRSLDKYPVVQS